MKSRVIAAEKEKILLYNISEETENILLQQGAECVNIPHERAGEKLTRLLTETEAVCDNAEIREEKCMVFCGISGKRLEELLNGLKSGGAEKCFKAVLTPTNKSWTLSELIDNLIAEQNYMQGSKNNKK